MLRTNWKGTAADYLEIVFPFNNSLGNNVLKPIKILCSRSVDLSLNLLCVQSLQSLRTLTNEKKKP